MRRSDRPGLGERVSSAFGLVLLLVFATFVAVSLVPWHDWGAVLITTLAVSSAVVALGTGRARRSLVVWSARLGAVAIALALISAFADGRSYLGISALLQMILLAAGAGAVLRAVVTEEKVGFRTILGAVSVYLTLGLLFASLFVGIDRLQGSPFFGAGVDLDTGDYAFFSVTTLTTTGYGNLVPAGQPGKMFAVMEMLIGQVFLVTLIARLVSMWQPGSWVRSGGGLIRQPPEPDEE
jgi:Ion channel